MAEYGCISLHVLVICYCKTNVPKPCGLKQRQSLIFHESAIQAGLVGRLFPCRTVSVEVLKAWALNPVKVLFTPVSAD